MRAGRSLWTACHEPHNVEARRDMSLASLFGGLALANAKLGAVHGLAGVLGGMFRAAHGAICARLLPYVMEANVDALRRRAAGSQMLRRYDEVAQILTGRATAGAAEGVGWVQALCESLKVQSLGDLGLKKEDFTAVAEKSQHSSSIKGNPIPLTFEELMWILQASL